MGSVVRRALSGSLLERLLIPYGAYLVLIATALPVVVSFAPSGGEFTRVQMVLAYMIYTGLIAIVFMYVTSWWINRELRGIRRGIEAVVSGEYTVIPGSTVTEFHMLAESIQRFIESVRLSRELDVPVELSRSDDGEKALGLGTLLALGYIALYILPLSIVIMGGYYSVLLGPRTYFLLTSLNIVIYLVAVYYLRESIVRPLEAIASSANMASMGDFSAIDRLRTIQAEDEIGNIARELVRLASAVELSCGRLEVEMDNG